MKDCVRGAKQLVINVRMSFLLFRFKGGAGGMNSAVCRQSPLSSLGVLISPGEITYFATFEDGLSQ